MATKVLSLAIALLQGPMLPSVVLLLKHGGCVVDKPTFMDYVRVVITILLMIGIGVMLAWRG